MQKVSLKRNMVKWKKQTVYDKLELQIKKLTERVENLEREAKRQRDVKRLKRIKRRVHFSND